MLELGAIGITLSAEDVSEDGDDDVVGVVLGVLDDSVDEEELNSDVFEAVGGKEEGNTVPLNDVTDFGLGLVGKADVKHFFSFFHKGEDFNFSLEVFVLDNLKMYNFKFFEFSINLGLDEIEGL